MDDLQVKQLIQKYLDGQCTAEESALIESWYLEQSTAFQRPVVEMIDRNEQLMLNFLESRIAEKKTVRLWPRIAIAAALALIVIGAYFFKSNFAKTDNDKGELVAADIAPGRNGATLTLANGKKIFINDALAGNIASQSGVKISKTADGQIIYEVTDQGTGKPEYNTLTTTRGEQTQVRLPDGSLVFLNAASSLRYPTSFAKSAKRTVGLTGEGYFEISKNKAQPFVVTAANQQVEVLGTHFNINAYAEESAVRTTLVEGSIKVTALGKSTVLKPNQQARLSNGAIEIKEVDAELALAWKSGFFLFDRESLESIMTKIARWYDVEVIYNDPFIKSETFTGTISRFEKLSQVFNMLERTGVAKFKIEGKKITIYKMKIN